MAEHATESDGVRLARIRRSVEASMAGTDAEFRHEREEIFRVEDVLWLLDHVVLPSVDEVSDG